MEELGFFDTSFSSAYGITSSRHLKNPESHLKIHETALNCKMLITSSFFVFGVKSLCVQFVVLRFLQQWVLRPVPEHPCSDGTVCCWHVLCLWIRMF